MIQIEGHAGNVQRLYEVMYIGRCGGSSCLLVSKPARSVWGFCFYGIFYKIFSLLRLSFHWLASEIKGTYST